MHNKNINKKLITLSLAATLVFSAVACGTTSGNDETGTKSNASVEDNGVENVALTAEDFNIDDVGEFTIRVGVNSGDQNQVLKILDDHTNFLKERGINLETTEFAAGINTIDAITTGQLDVGLFADYAGVNRIGNTLADTKLRAFAMIAKSDSTYLYVNPDTVTKVEDLAGKTVINMPGVVTEYEYGKLFETYGIDPASVEFANVSSAQEALALATNDSADAYWVGRINWSKFEEVGWAPLLNIGDIDATMYTYLVADESYLLEHEAEVAKFLAVSNEAFEYVENNLDEVAQWEEDDLGLAKELAIENWKAVTHEYTFPQEAYEDLLKVEAWCYQNGNFPTDYDFTDFINTDALYLVNGDKVTWQPK